MAKMFYSSEEAAQKLGITTDQLKDFVAQNKLREFRDGAKVMFKVDQVDALAATAAPKDAGATKGGSAIDLAPLGDTGGSDALSLADSTSAGGTGVPLKDDTTAAGQSGTGISVFDQGEVKSAGASEKTQIQPAVDDQLSLESVGSGSGLLDLTRESDDTSLGAELLDEIYPGGDKEKQEGIGSSSGIFEQTTPAAGDTGASSGLENAVEPASIGTAAPVAFTEAYEANDPMSGVFGGLALGAVLVMLIAIIALAAAFQGYMPGWLDTATADNTKVFIFAGILAVVSALFAGVGFFLGKARA